MVTVCTHCMENRYFHH